MKYFQSRSNEIKLMPNFFIQFFVLRRLDLESKIPDTLELGFFQCRPEEREAALLCLLKHVVEPNSLTIIFAATKHHVECLHLVRIILLLYLQRSYYMYVHIMTM